MSFDFTLLILGSGHMDIRREVIETLALYWDQEVSIGGTRMNIDTTRSVLLQPACLTKHRNNPVDSAEIQITNSANPRGLAARFRLQSGHISAL